MSAEILGIIIFLKIYLLKKEEEEEIIYFFSVKKTYFTSERQAFGEIPVKAASVTQREFCINMQIWVETFKSESRCATSFIAYINRIPLYL